MVQATGRKRSKQQTRARDPLANVRDAVVLSRANRARLQETVDDAVSRGRMTRTDAADLVARLLSCETRLTADLAGDVARLATRSGDAEANGDGPLPIADYDELTAAEVEDRLPDLSRSSCAPWSSTSAATRTARRCWPPPGAVWTDAPGTPPGLTPPGRRLD
jgi:hypothetical protein